MVDSYFVEELLNTEIKHNVLKKVLIKSMSIASVASYREISDLFGYVDLYAGKGQHDDGKKGSPLIALEAIDSFDPRNDFVEYKCIFTEIDVNRCDKLQKNLTSFHDEMRKKEKVEIFCEKGNWCDHVESIIKILSQTRWGFIFADPFANQINMDLFIKILTTQKIYSSKDIMIFVNYTALKRIIGTGDNTLIQKKVADFFGITVDNLNAQINKEPSGNIDFNLINKLFLERLKETKKDYICGFSIPNTKNGKLTNSDYFFLIFCTTDINMVDEFYKSYKYEMEKVKIDSTFYCTLHVKIDSLTLENPITLLSLFTELTSSFISWKCNLPEDIPTKNQIIDYLNDQSEKGLIRFELEDNSVLNKRSKNFPKLKMSLRKKDMEGIQIINV